MRTNIVELTERTIKDVARTQKDIYGFSHSESGIIFNNCRFDSFEKNLLNIFNFGSPSVAPKDAGNDVRNYVSQRDEVALGVGRFGYLDARITNASHVQFLEPTSNNIIEHAFRDAYSVPVEDVCRDIRKKHGIEE